MVDGHPYLQGLRARPCSVALTGTSFRPSHASFVATSNFMSLWINGKTFIVRLGHSSVLSTENEPHPLLACVRRLYHIIVEHGARCRSRGV